ncbi:EF-hand_domain pair [Hexamita inflata]|uniref:EF-hand domain pair n=1 Tax=Hexamita inflata TaxID=28002 RepID=A0AA86QQ74_9EUKA|nr:EF-hand domain pair [Hexamita inflata]CAI9933250.1 EF-hand domain pair [Hexamita inflata]CAI9958427.1 EF-hand domain pair [Hexamita inflata]CAI9968718.1 EF-hand domain pair [Hexamita inflata]
MAEDDRQLLRKEIQPYFDLVKTDKDVISKEDAIKIIKCFRYDIELDQNDKPFFTIDEFMDKCFEKGRLLTIQKERETDLLQALQTFEDPHNKGFIVYEQLVRILRNHMTEEQINEMFEGNKDDLIIDFVANKILRL